MSDYLYKNFFGKYRILAWLDNNTNDWPRDKDGNLDTDDFYIPCKNGALIQHYGGNILTAYIPSVIKANRLIKMCKEEGIDVFNIMDGDGEITFRFKVKHIDFIADYLGAKTSGKDIRPFSLKNLPKSDYTIPPENLENYKSIVAAVPKGELLIISRITDQFMDDILAKKHKRIDIKVDMKKKCMARQVKEYIHSMGMWDEYLKYLDKHIKNKYKDDKNEENISCSRYAE